MKEQIWTVILCKMLSIIFDSLLLIFWRPSYFIIVNFDGFCEIFEGLYVAMGSYDL